MGYVEPIIVLSNDILCGWLLSRDGKEMNSPDGKKGIRIMARMDIDTIFHLLDYGIKNYNRLVYVTDSIINLPYSERPDRINLPTKEIKQALNTELSNSKQTFIRKFVRNYHKRFHSYVNKN